MMGLWVVYLSIIIYYDINPLHLFATEIISKTRNLNVNFSIINRMWDWFRVDSASGRRIMDTFSIPIWKIFGLVWFLGLMAYKTS